jgi:ABC-type sulfate/molybdate transport systems ATPase subunit
MSIRIQNVSKSFGAFKALDDVSLDIESGELIALLSPSGMGKTTLLRIIAGLEWPDSGQVHFHGQDATGTHARDRNVGFVFQHYALFRHMTIFENVAFGLRVKKQFSEKQIAARVTELLKLVQLDWLAERYPHQLSGGQRQRIALARSLAVEQVGTPEEVYQSPASPFVYEFLGDVNLFHGRQYARPHEVEIHRDDSREGSIPAQVEHVAPRGPVVRIELRAANGTVEVDLSRERQRDLKLVAGQNVYIRPTVLREFEKASQIA